MNQSAFCVPLLFYRIPCNYSTGCLDLFLMGAIIKNITTPTFRPKIAKKNTGLLCNLMFNQLNSVILNKESAG